MANVKLNQSEEKILELLPLEQREAARKIILDTKSKKEAGRNERRHNFTTKVQPSGVVSVYGLGRQFPTSLYPSEWEKVFANKEAIMAACANAPKRS